MTSTYTLNQGIEKPAAGDQSGTWGGTVNTNMDIIDRAISGVVSITLTGATTTLTTTDGTLTDGMYRVLVLGDSGSDLGSDNTITISPADQDKAYLVYNNLSANRNAIFTQGSGANATIQNGETAWIYADGGGSGAIVRTAVSSVKITDQDGDTQIQVEEGGDDDDTIRFDLAGAEDFTMTANTFNVLTGSDLNINSGGTLTNAGTAYGFDNLPAFAGVLETNATFVDQVIFGPAVDGMAWNGKWTGNDSSGDLLYTSLMLATVEDATADTQVNIWDLTEQSAGVISTTVIGTVTLSGDATPTSIAASMGYLIVGSEDGISIIDPHSGSWAERTTGWPKTLSTSNFPVLDNASVNHVAAGPSGQPAQDPRTGGPMPSFGVSYGAGTVTSSILKDDGNVFSSTSNGSTRGYVVEIANGYIFQTGQDENQMRALYIDTTVADYSAAAGVNIMRDYDTVSIYMPTAVSKISVNENLFFGAPSSANVMIGKFQGLDPNVTAGSAGGLGARITRTYNTGLYGSSYVGVWLANSNTVDFSKQNNTLSNNGTVPTEAVESGAELLAYGPFSTSNYLSRASDADWDVLGTGAVHMSCWVKSASCVASEAIMGFSNSGGSIRCTMTWATTNGDFTWELQGASATVSPQSNTTGYDDDAWHKVDLVQVSSTERYMYVDGVSADDVSTTDCGSLSSSGNLPFAIGRLGGSSGQGATTTQAALARFSKKALTAAQVRDAYDMEKGMFVAAAKCFLQSGTTDACLDANVDPLTNKVVVTQTDKINIFDGLVNVSQPAANSGASEKGNLWGDLRAEINSANAYVTAPVVDQRQVNEMVRGLASDLPGGVDLSKAKAWCVLDGIGTVTIKSSFNVKSVSDEGTGQYKFNWAVPFKNKNYSILGMTTSGGAIATSFVVAKEDTTTGYTLLASIDHANNFTDVDPMMVVAFGELDNE